MIFFPSLLAIENFQNYFSLKISILIALFGKRLLIRKGCFATGTGRTKYHMMDGRVCHPTGLDALHGIILGPIPYHRKPS
jgi:hypothetical protein